MESYGPLSKQRWLAATPPPNPLPQGEGGHNFLYSSFAFARRANFWILPVEVLGSGPNTTVLGAL